jgi:glutaconate CoA-transferase subunit A
MSGHHPQDRGNATGGRHAVVVGEHEPIDRIQPGMTIAIGGFINAAHPMAWVRAIIRREIKNLTVVGAASSGLELDMLIAAGCVEKVISPYVGAEGLASIGPAFRRAAQNGELSIWELDEAHYYAGLRAAAQRLPFNPWRAGVGTSYPRLNPELREFRDPLNDELLIAVPAIEIDIALLHAAASDPYGNVQHHGSGYGDRAIHAAADATFVQVEQIVSNQRIRANPGATSIPGADGVARLPYGAHPFGSPGFHAPDADHISEYVAAAAEWLKSGSRARLDEYLDRYVHGPEDHVGYLEQVGVRRLVDLPEYTS